MENAVNVQRTKDYISANPVPLLERGFVYFIGDGEFIKIGYSALLDMRRVALQIGNARELKLLAFCHGTEAEEKALHPLFAAHAVRGEWFRASDELERLMAAVRESRPQIEAGTITVLDIADKVFGTEKPREERVCPPVPDTASKFEAWAHYACCKWPEALQVQGALALYSMQRPDLYAKEEYAKFLEMYAGWFDRQPQAA